MGNLQNYSSSLLKIFFLQFKHYNYIKQLLLYQFVLEELNIKKTIKSLSRHIALISFKFDAGSIINCCV